MSPLFDNFRHHLGAQVKHMHGEAGTQQRLGDTHAHGPEADDTYATYFSIHFLYS
jgi:hypothetical protein